MATLLYEGQGGTVAAGSGSLEGAGISPVDTEVIVSGLVSLDGADLVVGEGGALAGGDGYIPEV